jgi:hypothetical protein
VTEQGDQEYVWILGLEGEDDDEEEGDGVDRGLYFRRDEARVGRQRVPAEQLQKNIEGFVRAMGHAIAGVPSVLSGYSIDSIEISAEISASGKVSLLGNGGELAGTGGIAFTLTRVKVDKSG